ncbi:uncharacterized protein LOC112518554 [Cynara cardunculus var. scolymus]|uniref:uncharacterized protein LOC112518554 n=1 Tax=Cynara cardunculus var. scolymus TaxID=59895 RepID=UPI000D62F306|nr:uncharacterized protein LOC112518554 [Cynara cardunculus var. scolymus]
MGGDTISPSDSSIDDEDVMKKQLADRLSKKPYSRPGGLIGGKTAEDNNESIFGEKISRSLRDPYKCLESEANDRRMNNAYAQVLQNYDELNHRVVNMEVAKSKVLSYTPGLWVENVGGMTKSDYDVPITTTLLLIGPKGSGKSSLVNRISRVFEDDKFAPERAQVTYNSRSTNGTLFLQEYMIPRSSTSFCLYDTRSFSGDLSENLEMIKRWMKKGVSHGELVKSASDSSSLQARMKRKARQNELVYYERRTVNFVIFVVNGLSVLKCVESHGVDTQYTQMVAELFGSPFLSFKDHKPAIAITHGDLLSLSERARVRIYLGELLGVHPSKQTFDVPDNSERTTDLTIIDMVRYALEHADRNLPCKGEPLIFKDSIPVWACLLLLVALGIIIITNRLAHGESIPEPSVEVDWKTIRHLWSE